MPYRVEEMKEDANVPTGAPTRSWSQVVQASNRASSHSTSSNELFLPPLVQSSTPRALDFSHSSPQSSRQDPEEHKEVSPADLLARISALQESHSERQAEWEANTQNLEDRINSLRDAVNEVSQQLVDVDLNPSDEEDVLLEDKTVSISADLDSKVVEQINFLNRLLDEIDRLKKAYENVEKTALADFILQLINLHETALDGIKSEQNQIQSDRSKISAHVVIQFVSEAINMLVRLRIVAKLPNAKEHQLVIIDNYEKNCRQIYAACYHTPKFNSAFKSLLKIVTSVIVAAVGFVMGAAIGASIGILAGAWSGVGAMATGIVGLVHGAITGAALGLVAGAGVTSVAAGSLALYSLFKPAQVPRVEDSFYMVKARVAFPGK